MKIKLTSVLYRKADAREVASSYCKTRGAVEKGHSPKQVIKAVTVSERYH